MDHKSESIEKTFSAKNSSDDFNTWLKKDYISDELRTSLRKANLLSVPMEQFRGTQIRVFTAGTVDFLNYLRDNSTKMIQPEFCSEEKEYQELVLHNDLIVFGPYVLQNVILPLFVNMIYDYIKSRIARKTAKTDMKLELVVVYRDNKSINIKYEGPVDSFRETMKTIENIKEEDMDKSLPIETQKKEDK